MGNQLEAYVSYCKVKQIHGDSLEFPYIGSEYLGYLSEITAVCPIHGEFKSDFNSFRQGKRCPKCQKMKPSLSAYTPSQALAKIHSTIGDRYKFPYIENEYRSNVSQLTAVCDVDGHGEFTVSFANATHSGKPRGCPKCANVLRSNLFRGDVKDRLSSLLNKFGDKYTFPYIESEYLNNKSHLTVVCNVDKTHGIFYKDYSHLIKGQGCPKCSRIQQNINARIIPDRPGIVRYKNYHNRLTIDDYPTEGPYGELQVRCKTCQQLFIPTEIQVYRRIRCINTLGQGDGNFYCSDKCKLNCTIYGKSTRWNPNSITDYEAKVKLARNCQLETKRVLRQHQMDQHGYHFCEKCGKVVDNPELHHTIEVAKDPSGAITIAGQMLVCNECHKEFTRICK